MLTAQLMVWFCLVFWQTSLKCIKQFQLIETVFSEEKFFEKKFLKIMRNSILGQLTKVIQTKRFVCVLKCCCFSPFDKMFFWNETEVKTPHSKKTSKHFLFSEILYYFEMTNNVCILCKGIDCKMVGGGASVQFLLWLNYKKCIN